MKVPFRGRISGSRKLFHRVVPERDAAAEMTAEFCIFTAYKNES